MTDYLTMVFRQPINAAARALLESGEWTAASHSHAIHDRDEAKQEAEKLRKQKAATYKEGVEAAVLANDEIERLRAELLDSKVLLQDWKRLAEQRAAHLEALHKQEPVATLDFRTKGWRAFIDALRPHPDGTKLYLAAGAQPAPSVSDIVDRMSEFATHDIERGEMTFDKWSLREAVEATIVEAQPAPNPADAAQDLLAACKEFVRKVEAGEARSVRSYAQMKAAIAKAENAQPAPSVPAEYVTDATHEKVMDAIAAALGDAYDCLRVWEAWSYGTMSRDDFVQVVEQQDRLAEIADAAIRAMLVSGVQPAPSVPDTRLKVKLGSEYGESLLGHWFYLQPADEFACAALEKHTGVGAESEAPKPAPSAPEVTDTMALAFHCALTAGRISAQKVDEIKVGLRAALAAAPETPKRKPLTDKQLREVLEGANYMVRNAMHGPFWLELQQACRAVEAAHGIKE